MRITLGPTDQLEPIAEGVGQIWVGQTSSGIEIVAVIAVVGCKPEDHEAFMRESAAGNTGLQFVQAATAEPPDSIQNSPARMA